MNTYKTLKANGKKISSTLFVVLVCLSFNVIAKNDSSSLITKAPDTQNVDQLIDIKDIIQSAEAGTTIQLPTGEYHVDNPIVIENKIKIVGSGKNNTILKANNANKPFFVFATAGITLESVTVDALVEKGPHRASIAVMVNDGSENCAISQTKIINAAASAILGRAASGCSLIGNTILNSGDDAVRLHGEHLTVADNTIIRYFDEALDLAFGDGTVVTGNYISEGRIGIVIDDCSDSSISQNYVEKQILQGIVSSCGSNSTVTANTVKDVGYTGYNLHSTHLVANNLAIGNYKEAFHLEGMNESYTYRNVSIGSEHAFVYLDNHHSSDDSGNNNNHNKDSQKSASRYENCQQSLTNKDNSTCNTYFTEEHPALRVADQTVIDSTEVYTFTPTIKISGTSKSDIKRANKVAELFKYYNPGILTIHIEGAEMRSKITDEMYAAIKGTETRGIGLVRAPFLQFSGGGQRSFQWYLSIDDKNVVLVSSIYDGPRAKTTLLNNNGEISTADMIELYKDKILFKLFK